MQANTPGSSRLGSFRGTLSKCFSSQHQGKHVGRASWGLLLPSCAEWGSGTERGRGVETTKLDYWGRTFQDTSSALGFCWSRGPGSLCSCIPHHIPCSLALPHCSQLSLLGPRSLCLILMAMLIIPVARTSHSLHPSYCSHGAACSNSCNPYALSVTARTVEGRFRNQEM